MALGLNSRTALRIAILISWLSLILGVLGSYALESDLPVHLQQYLAWDLEQDMSQLELILLVVGLVFLVGAFIGSVGMFVFRVWGRNLYVLSIIVILALTPFFGPTVENAYESFFSELETLSDGLILGILFFTDAISTKQGDA